MLVTDVVTGGRGRAATRPPRGSSQGPEADSAGLRRGESPGVVGEPGRGRRRVAGRVSLPSGVRVARSGPAAARPYPCGHPGGPGLRGLHGREPWGALPGLSPWPRAPPRCVGLGGRRQASALAPAARSRPSVRAAGPRSRGTAGDRGEASGRAAAARPRHRAFPGGPLRARAAAACLLPGGPHSWVAL